MKEEDEWDSPHIVRYLDILSHEEIEKIKELAKPRVRDKALDCDLSAPNTTVTYSFHDDIDHISS